MIPFKKTHQKMNKPNSIRGYLNRTPFVGNGADICSLTHTVRTAAADSVSPHECYENACVSIRTAFRNSLKKLICRLSHWLIASGWETCVNSCASKGLERWEQ